MSEDVVIAVKPLGFPWETADPFLFCVHHLDAYPAGNEHMGPAASLRGRKLGNDFVVKDGFRMYHGDVVPGFPQHPHRGFETITIVRRGLVDHSDSLGATARFGDGDVQWLTAGAGIVHSEMFPLVDRDAPNPLELFQIWLNLPRAQKHARPHFSMLWRESIPELALRDEEGRTTRVIVVAGTFGDAHAPAPPPESWASHPDADVRVLWIAMDPGARVVLPPARPGTNRVLYLYEGDAARVGASTVQRGTSARLRAELPAEVEAGQAACRLLLLDGRPIGEPVVSYGPFVMNTPAEIEQAFRDYQRTGFGGWPWPSDGPVHARDEGRFAKHPDGRVERR